MKRAFSPPAFGLLGIGFLLAPVMAAATEARVVSVRRGSGGGPALLLRVADGATLSTQDVSALLDAAGSRGSAASSQEVKAAVHGRRFGDVAVVSPPEPRAASPVRKRASPPMVRASTERKSAAPPAPKAVKPDVTIFAPNEPPKPAAPPPPAGAPPEANKQP